LNPNIDNVIIQQVAGNETVQKITRLPGEEQLAHYDNQALKLWKTTAAGVAIAFGTEIVGDVTDIFKLIPIDIARGLEYLGIAEILVTGGILAVARYYQDKHDDLKRLLRRRGLTYYENEIIEGQFTVISNDPTSNTLNE